MSPPSLRDNARGIAKHMLGMLKDKNINIYSTFGYDIKYENNKLQKWQREELTSTVPDTEYNYNSTPHKTDTILRKRDNFQPDSVCKFNLLEEWTFNPHTDKITIEIQYIEPLTNRYLKDGAYLGSQPAFRMSYDDVCTHIIIDSRKNYLREALNYCIWQSYFVPGAAETPGDLISYYMKDADAIMETEVRTTDDTIKHFLSTGDQQPPLTELIVDSIKAKKLSAFDTGSAPFSHQLSKIQLLESISGRVDTVDKTDTLTGRETIMIIRHDFNFSAIHSYKVLQHWHFDPLFNRKTEITLKAIAPMHDEYNDSGLLTGTKTMFWVKYKDVQPIIQQSETYNPENNFALHIWQHFFTTADKPVIEK